MFRADRAPEESISKPPLLCAVAVAAALLALVPAGASSDVHLSVMADEKPDEECPEGQALSDEGCVSAPVRTRHVPPVYPKEAKRARKEGDVNLEIVVDKKGRVKSAKLIETTAPGYGLESAAKNAVYKWRYKPSEVNG